MRGETIASNWLAALVLGAVLSSCATLPPEQPQSTLPKPTRQKARISAATPPQLPGQRLPPASPGNLPFYEVMGERYYVMPDSTGYSEQGVASWYGREFHGRHTSNGEVYDMYAMTAAHKTLPLPTTARVTNLANGRSIVVRINDRGPFKKGRVIDLSYAAARELGFVNDGTALVEVAAIDAAGSGAAVASRAPAAHAMYVQVGAFGEQRNAENLRQRLQQQGFGKVVVRYDDGAPAGLYRVRIGPVASAEEYDALVRRIEPLNLGSPRLVVETSAAGTGAAAAGASPGG